MVGRPPWLVDGVRAVHAVGPLGLGVALFAAPHAAPLWLWKLMLLLAQATGARPISFGVAAGDAPRKGTRAAFGPQPWDMSCSPCCSPSPSLVTPTCSNGGRSLVPCT